MLKDSFFHLPVFLALFVVAFIVCMFLALLVSWTGVYNPAFSLEPGWLGMEIRANGGRVLMASLFVSLFLLFFRVRKRPGNRLLSFILPLIASFIIMLVGITFVYGPPGSPLPREYDALVPFVPNTIHETENELLYIERVTGTRETGRGITISNAVRYHDGDLRLIRGASVAVRSSNGDKAAVIVPSDVPDRPVIVTPANPLYNPVFELPATNSALSRDITALNSYLLEKRAVSPGRFSLSLFSILLLAVSCMFFMRSGRWPLFSALMTLGAFRGILLLIRLFESEIGIEVKTLLPEGVFSDMFFAFVVLVIGLLITAMYFVFPGKRNG